MAARFLPARRRAVTALAVLLALALVGSANYTVRPGDTLLDISIRTGVKIADLRALNDIADPDLIYHGRRLTLRGASASPVAAPASSADGVVHTVAPGETALGLAVRYGSSVGAITSANELSTPHLIRIGERLLIPGGSAGTPRAAASSRAQMGALLDATARRYGMSPQFVKAVAWQESGWNPHVVSSANAVGVMQVLPSTGRFVSRHIVGRDLDLNDPADNVEAGVAFLRYLYRLADGDVDMTLAGYYQGLRSVRDNGMYDDTRRYIANIQALRSRF